MVSKVLAFLAALFIVSIVVVATPSHALDFGIDMVTEPSTSAVHVGESAQFNVKVSNNENVRGDYRIEIMGPYVWSWLQTNYDASGSVPANFTKLIPVKISPSLETPPGDYQYSITGTAIIDGKARSLPTKIFTITVLKSGEAPARAAFVVLRMDKEIYDPGDSAQVMVSISKLTVAAQDLQIDLRLLDPKRSPVYEYFLPMLEQAEPILLSHSVPISAIMPPGDYFVVADLKLNGKTVGTVERTISISTVNKPEQRRTAEVSALGKKVVVKVENTGNVQVSGEIREPMRWYERFLLTANPTPALETGAGGYYWIVWKYVNVMPGDLTRTYAYSISYVPVALAVLLVILLAVAAWQTVRALSVTKEVIRQKISSTTLEASISVHVKNLSDRTIRDVVLVDALPGMARPLEFTTAKPANVKKEENKTVMEWTLGDLKPREERVITYTMHTTFGVVGLIALPVATARFTGADGKRRHTSSGIVECGVVA